MDFLNFLGIISLTIMAFAIVFSVAVGTLFIISIMYTVGISTIIATPAGLLLTGIFLAITSKMAYAITVFAIQNRGQRLLKGAREVY